MGRGIAVTFAALGVLACWAPAASATPTQIEFGSNYFNPNDVTVDFVPGENTFEWNRNDASKNFHSITARGGSFGIGPGGFGDFNLRMSAGTYPYYCVNHGQGAGPMQGQVAVSPIVGVINSDDFDVIWAGGGTQTGGSFATRWKKQGQSKWKDWHNFIEAKHKVFGANDNPTHVKLHKTYVIQARSSGPGSSKWSPKLSVTVEP